MQNTCFDYNAKIISRIQNLLMAGKELIFEKFSCSMATLYDCFVCLI